MFIANRKKYTHFSNAKTSYQQGFSLIEILVSLLIISSGLLSLTGLQANSTKSFNLAYIETQGTLYLQEMAEILRTSKPQALKGELNIPLTSFDELSSGGGNNIKKNASISAEVARYQWFNNLNEALPSAKASIQCDGRYNGCTLELVYESSGKIQKQTLAVIL